MIITPIIIYLIAIFVCQKLHFYIFDFYDNIRALPLICPRAKFKRIITDHINIYISPFRGIV